MEAQPLDPAGAEYQQFVRQYVKHEGVLRSFVRSLVPDWNDVDEVVQETFLVAWRKYEQFQADTNFRAWICAIGRFEALRYLRQRGRQAMLFSNKLVDLLEVEAGEEFSSTTDERDALEQCLNKLPERARNWLRQAYQPAQTIRQLAAETGHSVEACYKMVQRLRHELLECIRRTLSEGKPA